MDGEGVGTPPGAMGGWSLARGPGPEQKEGSPWLQSGSYLPIHTRSHSLARGLPALPFSPLPQQTESRGHSLPIA